MAEVKGVTKSPETAVDIGYGQILRVMSRHPEATEAALVASEHLRSKVLRVTSDVRRRLGLNLYLVDDFGAVTLVDE